MEWLNDLLSETQKKEAAYKQGENKEDHFEKKLASNPWVDGLMSLDEKQIEAEYQANLEAEAKLLGKTASQEGFKTTEQVIESDFARQLKSYSDYNLTEMLALARAHKDNITQEKFGEYKEKAKSSVASGRDKCEKELLELSGSHTLLDWKKAFEKFSKDAKVEQPAEKDLYQPIAPEKEHDFQKPTEDKFKTPKDQEKAIPGNGREADERKEVTQQAGVTQESLTEGLGKVAELTETSEMEKDSAQNQDVINAFVSGRGGASSANLHIVKGIGGLKGMVLVNYETPIAYRSEDGSLYMNSDKYSVTTSKIQNYIRQAAGSNLKSVSSDDLSKIMNESTTATASLKVADKVKDSPANDTGNLALPEGKKSAGDAPVEAVEEPTAGDSTKTVGDKSDQAAEANSPEKGDAAKSDEAVNKKSEYQPKTGEPCSCRKGIERDNCPSCEGTGSKIDFKKIREGNKEAHCGSCPGDPGVPKTADMCPVCGGMGKDLANGQKDSLACMACGITYAPEGIKSRATKEDVLKIIKQASVESPWRVVTDSNGQEVIARISTEDKNEKISEEDTKDNLVK